MARTAQSSPPVPDVASYFTDGAVLWEVVRVCPHMGVECVELEDARTRVGDLSPSLWVPLSEFWGTMSAVSARAR